jgi:hypothetical protein
MAPGEAWLEDGTEPGDGRQQGLSRLWERLDRLVKPPEQAGLVLPTSWNGRLDFFAESPIRGRLGKAYAAIAGHFVRRTTVIGAALVPTAPVWLRIAGGLFRSSLPRDFEAHARSQWASRFGGALRSSPATAEELVSRLAPAYGWLDQLASYYADRHRSAFTVIFSLAWIAAVAAVLGLVAAISDRPTLGYLMAGVELFVILVIIVMTAVGKRRHYHEKWLDYRLLAEQLRHLTFLWPLGVAAPSARLGDRPRPQDHGPRDAGDSRIRWTGWYYRAIVRQLGFGAVSFSDEHRRSCRSLLRELEIPTQQEYHNDRAERLEHVHQAVHYRTDWLFGLAAVVALVHLVGHLQHWPEAVAQWVGPTRLSEDRLALAISGGLTVLSVFLPARAAALHGWAGHAELHAGSIRSAQVELRLAELARSIDGLSAGPEDEGDAGPGIAPPPSSTALGRAARDVARVLEGELGTWRAISLSRPLGWF